MAREHELRVRRRARVRRRVAHGANGRLRLSVFRSNRYIYAQIIDDSKGETVAFASNLEKDLEGGANREAAAAVGRLVARRAVEKGVTEVVFDRGPYLYHGRVKALAEAAREGGLIF